MRSELEDAAERMHVLERESGEWRAEARVLEARIAGMEGEWAGAENRRVEVEEALRGGFMRWPAVDQETALRRKLVVRTFAEDPEG